MKRVVFFFIKLAFICCAFILLFRPETFGFDPEKFQDISIPSLLEVFRQLDTSTLVFWLALASLVKLLGIFCAILRWRLLLRGQGLEIPFWYLSKMFFMGRAVGLWLPGTTGLDGYRLVQSSRYTGEAMKCTAVIAVEKLTGLIALFGLVFLTLPLGMRLFTFNPIVLGAVLLVLGAFVATSLMLLLNPRVIQVLAAVFPTPRILRDKVDRLGVAVTSYSGQRGILIQALALAFGVHLAICFIYFGTASALRAENIGILDVLFTAPLYIVASVLTPTVNGAGVREVVFVTILGARAGSSRTLIFSHLGMWIGEVVPFILSIPLLLFATKPKKEELIEGLEELRGAAAQPAAAIDLSPAGVRAYRVKLLQTLCAGLAAGLAAGALLGLAEAAWHMNQGAQFNEAAAYWWAPLVYGIAGAGAGFGAACVLSFLYLLWDRFASSAISYGLSGGAVTLALSLPVALFRYRRDVLLEHALSGAQMAAIAGGALAAALIVAAAFTILARLTPHGFARRGAFAALAFLSVLGCGLLLSAIAKPTRAAAAFDPPQQATGPNIILIAVDTLRADYLKAFSEGRASANTPAIDALAADGVLFRETFAQSSWTKASFATIFSGLYPEAHTATSKASSLPDEVTTFPETLEAAGYFTKGYSNNPNIESTFNYDQGFVDYVDLKPDLLLGAQPSAQKLVLYDILRKVKQVLYGKVLRGRIGITDFYQPAEVVTREALDWLDGAERPGQAPFFLFLHYMDPHDPFRDPERPGKGYARAQLGQNVDPEIYRERFIRSYNYEIECLDKQLAVLVDGLKERGLYEDALVVFTSDHGEEFHEHGGWWHGLSLYDEQIAVPLIIKLPGNGLAGSVNPYLTRHVDLAPTIIALAGLAPPAAMQGKPLFDDGFAPANADAGFNYSHLDFEGIQLKAIRSMTDKLITANEGNKRDYAPIELYDLEADPGEQENNAGKGMPEESEFLALIAQMGAYVKENAAEPVRADETGGVSEQLKDLGYL